jgi:murein DD-endopeptidase MepM/ murein hydrolase activator NlpD
MKKYTVRFAHLVEIPDFRINFQIVFGNCIGTMGSSGKSRFNHLHIDVVENYVVKIIRLYEIGDYKKYKPSEKQLNFFIDDDLFKISPHVTTPYLDPEYKEERGKDHHAIDVVPIDRHSSKQHFPIHWNRSKLGHVLAVGNDPKGYGNYILIGFGV